MYIIYNLAYIEESGVEILDRILPEDNIDNSFRYDCFLFKIIIHIYI